MKLLMYLQVLDFVTTMAGLRLGLIEGNPIVRWMIHAGPVVGVAASKVFVLLFGGFCYRFNHDRLLRRMNYWSAAIVAWNFVLIATSSRVIWR